MSPLLEGNHYLGEEQDQQISCVKFIYRIARGLTVDSDIMSLTGDTHHETPCQAYALLARYPILENLKRQNPKPLSTPPLYGCLHSPFFKCVLCLLTAQLTVFSLCARPVVSIFVTLLFHSIF